MTYWYLKNKKLINVNTFWKNECLTYVKWITLCNALQYNYQNLNYIHFSGPIFVVTVFHMCTGVEFLMKNSSFDIWLILMLYRYAIRFRILLYKFVCLYNSYSYHKEMLNMICRILSYIRECIKPCYSIQFQVRHHQKCPKCHHFY